MCRNIDTGIPQRRADTKLMSNGGDRGDRKSTVVVKNESGCREYISLAHLCGYIGTAARYSHAIIQSLHICHNRHDAAVQGIDFHRLIDSRCRDPNPPDHQANYTKNNGSLNKAETSALSAFRYCGGGASSVQTTGRKIKKSLSAFSLQEELSDHSCAMNNVHSYCFHFLT